jgi:hypothetical protein
VRLNAAGCSPRVHYSSAAPFRRAPRDRGDRVRGSGAVAAWESSALAREAILACFVGRRGGGSREAAARSWVRSGGGLGAADLSEVRPSHFVFRPLFPPFRVFFLGLRRESTPWLTPTFFVAVAGFGVWRDRDRGREVAIFDSFRVPCPSHAQIGYGCQTR